MRVADQSPRTLPVLGFSGSLPNPHVKASVTDVLAQEHLERKPRRKGQVTVLFTLDLGSVRCCPSWPRHWLCGSAGEPGWVIRTSLQGKGALERSESQNINQMRCKIVPSHAS